MMNRRTTRTISGFLLILLLCAALLSGAVLADGPAYGAGPFLTRPALPGQSALPGVTGIDDGPHALAWIFAPASIIVIGGTAAVSLSDGAEPMAVFSAALPGMPVRSMPGAIPAATVPVTEEGSPTDAEEAEASPTDAVPARVEPTPVPAEEEFVPSTATDAVAPLPESATDAVPAEPASSMPAPAEPESASVPAGSSPTDAWEDVSSSTDAG